MALETDKLTIDIVLDSKDAEGSLKKLKKTIADLTKETEKYTDASDEAADSTKDAGDAAKDAGRDQKDYSSSLDKSFKALTALNQGLELALKAYRGISSVVESTTKAFAVQEKAEIGLANALKLNGEFSNAAVNNFKDFAAELQAVSTVGDETTLGLLSIAKAMKLTNDEAKGAVKAAADLSAATGKDLNASFEKIIKTFGGTAGELAENVEGMKNLTEAELKAGAAIELVNKQFKGFAAAARDAFSGKQIAAANAFGDALEEVGELFVNVFDLGGKAVEAEQFFIRVGSAVDEFRRRLEFVIANVNFDKLLSSLSDLAKFIGAVLTPVLIKLALPLAAITTQIAAVTAAVVGLVLALDLMIRNVDQIDAVFRAIGATIEAVALKGIEKFGEFFKFITDKFSELLLVAVNSGVITGRVAASIQRAIGAISLSIARANAEFARGSEEAAAAAVEAFEELNDEGLLGGLVDAVDEVTAAMDRFGAAQDSAADKQETILAKTRVIGINQAEANKIIAERLRILEQITNANLNLKAVLDSIGADEEERIQIRLALELAAIDKEIRALMEKGIIRKALNSQGQVEVTHGKEILAALNKQKDLIKKITEMSFQSTGTQIVKFITDAAKLLTKGGKAIKKGLDFFKDNPGTGFAKIGAFFQEMGQGFMATISDPKALASFSASLIDSAIAFGSEIAGFISGVVSNVSNAIGGAKDFIVGFDQAAIDSMAEIPQKLAEGMANMPVFIEAFTKAFTDGIGIFIEAAPAVLQKILSSIPALLDAVFQGLEKLIDMLPAIFQQLFQKIPEFVAQILDALPTIIEKLSLAIPQIMASLFEAIPSIITNILDRLPAIIGALIEGFIGGMGEIIGAFIDTFISKGGAIKIAVSLTKAILKMVPTIIISVIKGMVRALKGILGGFKMPALDVTPFTKSVEKVVNKVSAGAAKVSEEIFSAIELPDPTKALATPGKGPAESIGEALKLAGKSVGGILDRFLDMLKKAWMWVWNNVIAPIGKFLKQAWAFVISFFKSIGKIIKSAWDVVFKFMGQLAKPIMEAFKPIFKLFSDIGPLLRKAFDFIFKAFGSFLDNVKGVFSGIIGKFTGWIEGVTGGFSDITVGLTSWTNNVKAGFEFIRAGLMQYIENLKVGFEFIRAGLMQWFENVRAGFELIRAGLMQWFENVRAGFELIKGGLMQWLENVKAGFEFIKSGLMQWLENLKAAYTFIVAGLMQYIANLKAAFEIIKTWLMKYIEAYKAVFEQIKTWLMKYIEGYKAAFEIIKTWLMKWVESYKAAFEIIKTWLMKYIQAYKSVFELIKTGLMKWLDNVKSIFSLAKAGLMKWIDNVKSGFRGFQKVAGTLVSGLQAVIGPFRQLASALKNFKMPGVGGKGGFLGTGIGLAGSDRDARNAMIAGVQRETVDKDVDLTAPMAAFNNRFEKASLRPAFEAAAKQLKEISGAKEIVANNLDGMRQVIEEVARFNADLAAQQGVLSFGEASSSGFRNLKEPEMFAHGGLVGERGGIVETPGEFVLNRSATNSIGVDTAEFINRTGRVPSGASQTTSVNVSTGAITIIQREGENPREIAERVLEEIKEQSLQGRFVIAANGVRAN